MTAARRILFLNNQGLGLVGGGVTILRELTADLAQDHAVTLVTDEPPSPTAPAIEQIRLPPFQPGDGVSWRFKPWLKARHLRRVLDPDLLRQADVVVALDPHFALALRRSRVSRLVHLSLSCVCRQEWFAGGVARRWYPRQYALLERLMAQQAQAMVVASQTHADEMRQFVDARGQAMTVLPPIFGYDDAASLVTRDSPTPVAVVLGRLTAVKNVDALVPLLAALPDLQLAVVGDGDPPKDLQSHAQALGVADRITWVGAKTDPRPWLDRASLLLHPSRYESFGIALFEAMSRGVVPVAFSAGPGRRTAAAELIDHGRNGLLVDFDDTTATATAVRRVLQDASAWRAMSVAAVATTRRLLPSHYTRDFRRVLDGVRAST